MNLHSTSPSRTDLRTASRLNGIGVSPIAKLTMDAFTLRSEGREVIALNAGEPDFDTPSNIVEAAIHAMRGGQTRYTALDGTRQLKLAVQSKFWRENRLDFALEEIIVGAGSKMILFNALMATLNPGDEVILGTPYWTTYADIIALCAGVTVRVECAETDGFRMTAQALERAITSRTRWVVLNSPSNPSGAVYSIEDYRPVLDVLLRNPHVWLLCDDIYEHIVYDGAEFVTAAQLEPVLRSRTLTVNGVSKAYAMTGWRLGYGAGPKALIEAMTVVQSQSTSCASSIAQAAAVEALSGPQDSVRSRCRQFQHRRDLLIPLLNEIDGITCEMPAGAFYAYPNCSKLIGRHTPNGTRLESDADFCHYLLHVHGVAAVPGSAFGLSPYFRLSYASSDAEIVAGARRIAQACALLE